MTITVGMPFVMLLVYGAVAMLIVNSSKGMDDWGAVFLFGGWTLLNAGGWAVWLCMKVFS